MAIISLIFACVKRIFSLCVSMFGTAQQSELEDRRESSVSMKFNKRQRANEAGRLLSQL